MKRRDPIDDLIDDLKAGLIVALADGRNIHIQGELVDSPEDIRAKILAFPKPEIEPESD